MSLFSTFVGVVLPPITLVVFVTAVASRVWRWRKLPQPGMTLFPTPAAGTTAGVLKETFLFPSLFRADRVLWVMSWFFHAMLAVILLGHVRVFTDFPALWAALHIDAGTMSAVAGGAAGLLIMLMCVLLLFRRALIQRVREISGAGDYAALALVFATILTGNAMRFATHLDLEQTRLYFAQLFAGRLPTVHLNPWFMAHLLVAQMLILYIPFSKIMHFGGVFFTQAAVKRS